ncbi:Adenine nucleotide alpha hydrolases-like protein [Glarea lozoyensis ATCC 20868]|uniref:Adenine nucleotide alpha hydrolases-like protein n=1 Tax=Glarea lozoyensis (strain ATCC 20868 / MF5171) TaxID=1116229 RepID=S3D175_GLAL2|nr:Adenine nucleotide alpha hydrolases-like protein [Glarea lozoyensis ATCC 20868]EPE31605.1 Adenine nucleotide alpha hydrolases-like protein [Glarea lozoyensis ATCC 20868]
MCGIHASVSTKEFQGPTDGLKQLLCNRGPDHLGEEEIKFEAEDGTTRYISFTSTVLALRGGHITTQPFKDSASGCILCWNGEAWAVDSTPVVGNDGKFVFDLLLKASSSNLSSTESVDAIVKVLRSISGPFAFVFLDSNHGFMYFGRDCLGRRSLLLNKDTSPLAMELSSCADHLDSNWKEVEADGIYQLSLNVQTGTEETETGSGIPSTQPLFPCQRYSWDAGKSEPKLGVFNKAIPNQGYMLNLHSPSVQQLRDQLYESLKPRILNVLVPPGQVTNQNVRIAVLFSGGLDCTVLARIAHELLPADQEIDLLNVAFENPRTINAANKALQTGKQKTTPSPNKKEEEEAPGGSPEVSTTVSCYEKCPDRETGRKAFAELRSVCPSRHWRFVAVNVPYAETLAHKSKVIGLISPHNTEMDLSIAYALYFASRGCGMASTDTESAAIQYQTSARILLSGLGADELFGGYTRHTTAFRRNGYPALLDELELDVRRLGKRNLGRDDRVISYWGREARFPYLDESLVKWAVERPVWEKCGFSNEVLEASETPQVDPEKKILRLVAYGLGMPSVAVEKKRAIQFGARTAKMEIGRTKGTTLIT